MSQALLIQMLRAPETASKLKGRDWSVLFRQARFSGLTGRIAGPLLDIKSPPDGPPVLPEPLQRHLQAAQRVCAAQLAEVGREARHLDRALADLGAPVILLKGAAYAMAGLPAAQGRVFSDVDILVPKSHLLQAESLLMLHGWMTSETSTYNQHYYREWMHELPPMRHLQRGTTLDVHHTILPETARLKPEAAKLIESALPLAGTRVLHVLSPVDRVLHSMTHLFLNDEMGHALRDLSDLDLLLRDASVDQLFWDALVPRAVELNLQRPLHYGLHELQRVLGTPVPTAVSSAAQQWGPGALLSPLMNWIWDQTFSAPAPASRLMAREVATWMLYLRGHWLRMPPFLLVRHLTIKAFGWHESDRPESRVKADTPT